MPIYSPTGFLDITNATLRTSNTECQNLQIGSGNIYVTTDVTSNLVLNLENITNLGNITSNTVQFTNATTGLVATGNVHALKFIGDGSQLTGIAAGGGSSNLHQVVENGNVTSNTVQFTNATTGLTVSSNLVVTGNVTAGTFLGNGSGLTNIPPSAITGTLSQWSDGTNSDVYIASNVGIGNVHTLTSNTLQVGANLYVRDADANVLTVTGNVAATRFVGDGSLLTGISDTASNLHQAVENGNVTSNTVQFTNATTGFVTTSNIQVGGTLKINTISAAAYHSLQAVTNIGSVTSNTVQFSNAITSLTADSNVVVTGNVTAGSFLGDGSGLTTLNATTITTGTLAAARIPNLGAAKITSGTLAAARIPNLDAAKITTGTLGVARIPTLNQSTTGSAATLTTPRSIGGVNFNGSAAITPTTFEGATFSGDVAFDTNTLFVDVSAKRVGIGTTTPNANLDVIGLATVSNGFTIGTTKTFVVTAIDNNKYYIDGVDRPLLELQRGQTYIFDMSDSSNSGHPLAFSTAFTGSSSSYTTGITSSGTAGNAGSKVTFSVPLNAPSSIYYYCTVHGAGMGSTGTASSISPAAELVVTGNVAVDTNTLFVDSTNNRVGVGTSSPTSALDVNGTVTATAFSGSGSGLTALNAVNITGTLPVARGGTGTTTSTGSGGVVLSNAPTISGNSYFSGNVGIGTTSPGRPLDVQFTADSGMRVKNSGSSHASVYIDSASGYSYLRFESSGAAKFWLQSSPNGDLAFRPSGGGHVMDILNNGNVGIGESSPKAKLHIKSSSGGDGIAIFNPSGGTGGTLNLSGGVRGGILISNGGGGSNSGDNYSSQPIVLTGGGTGATEGNIRGGSIWSMWGGSQYGLAFKGASDGESVPAGGHTPNLFVSKDKVGIGTKGPTYTLHVNGSLFYSSGGQNGSDDRIKYNEENITNALDIICKLKPQKYEKIMAFPSDATGSWIPTDENWETVKNAETKPWEGFTHGDEYGFIAQDVRNIPEVSFLVSGSEMKTVDESVSPEEYVNLNEDEQGTYTRKYVYEENVITIEEYTNLISENKDKCTGIYIKQVETQTPLGLNYQGIFVVAVKAIQEIDAQLQAEKAKVTTLESQLASVLTRLDALENA